MKALRKQPAHNTRLLVDSVRLMDLQNVGENVYEDPFFSFEQKLNYETPLPSGM